MAKATGATVVMTLADMEGNETFDPANLGQAEEVAEETVADNDMVMIRGPKNTRAVTGGSRGRAAGRWLMGGGCCPSGGSQGPCGCGTSLRRAGAPLWSPTSKLGRPCP